jgi:phosphoribosyl 1,2-cyclic phosphate phosphodiesterase
VGAERTYLTHLSHRASQAELDARLPDGVFAAYDGLEVEV